LRLYKPGEFASQNKAQNGPKVYAVNVADIWEESGYAYPGRSQGYVIKRKFLGFTFYINKGKVRIRPHEKSIKRLKNKIRKITNRNVGTSMEWRIKRLNILIISWINYFKIADMKGKLREIDKWTRRRLRACIWKQWKKVKTKFVNLKKLGIPEYKAWEYANTRKGYWRISKSPILNKTLTNQYWINQGLKTFSIQYSKLNLS
jgi:hypothetical protein